MRKNKVIITDDLIDDLKRYSNEVCKSLAVKTREILYETSQLAIEAFYDDYDPLYYKRHNKETGRQPYNFEENSFSKYYKNPHNSIYRGGVLLSYEDMADIYQDSTEEVFDLVYAGFHGVASGFVSPKTFHNIPPVMSPSPLELIKIKQKYIQENIEKYRESAVKNANKLSYKTLT